MSINYIKTAIATTIASSAAAVTIFTATAQANDNAKQKLPIVFIPIIACQINNPKEKPDATNPAP
jgi:hypothetical protein